MQHQRSNNWQARRVSGGLAYHIESSPPESCARTSVPLSSLDGLVAKEYKNCRVAMMPTDVRVTWKDFVIPIIAVLMSAPVPKTHTPPIGEITRPRLLASEKLVRLMSRLQEITGNRSTE